MARGKSRRPRRRQAGSLRGATRRSNSASFAEEYQYVIADLKRIFILAGVMLALLIALALIMR